MEEEPWDKFVDYQPYGSQQPSNNAASSLSASNRQHLPPYGFSQVPTSGLGTPGNNVLHPGPKYQPPSSYPLESFVHLGATSDYSSNPSNDIMVSSVAYPSQLYGGDVVVNHSVPEFPDDLPSGIPPTCMFDPRTTGDNVLQPAFLYQPPSDVLLTQSTLPESRRNSFLHSSNNGLRSSGASGLLQRGAPSSQVRSFGVPASHSTSGGGPSSSGSIRDIESAENSGIGIRISPRASTVVSGRSKATIDSHYRVHKRFHPRSHMNSNVLLGSINFTSVSDGRPSVSNQEDQATEFCRFWIDRNPNKLPTAKDCRILGKQLSFPPELLRERFQRQIDDSGYYTTASSKPDPTLIYEKAQYSRRKPGTIVDDISTSNLKDKDLPFVCTHKCGVKGFAEKGAWVKHEETHYRQQLWLCTIPSCPEKEKPWFRRDHFKNHFKTDHKDIEMLQQHYKVSRLPINSRYPRKCHFKKCEYRNFVDWKDRNNHIATHYQDDYYMSDWDKLEDETTESDIVATAALEDSSMDSSDEDVPDAEDEDNSNFKGRHDGPGTGGPGSASGSGTGQGSDRQGSSGSRPSDGYPNVGGNSNVGSSHYKGQGNHYNSYQMCLRAQYALILCSKLSMELSLVSPKGGIDNFERVQGLHTRFRPHWEMGDFTMYSIRRLGFGATATVDEVKVRGAKATMARKLLRYQYPAERKKIDLEVYNMHRLEHSHIVRLISILSDTSTVTLFMKPAADYTLSYYLRTHRSTVPPSEKTWKWFGCLVSGLQHIHAQNIIHCDVKPDNLLIYEGQIFYADFGLSTTVPDDRSMVSHSGFMTKQYAAPEVKKGRCGKPSDVFSLGLVFLELATAILHQSIADVYTSHCRSPDISYSNNLDVVAECIIALEHVGAIQYAPEAVYTALYASKAMTLAKPEERPSATDLTRSIFSQSCCFAFDHAIRRLDTYNSPTIEQAYSLNYMEQQTLRSVFTTVSFPPTKQFAMLQVWLVSHEWHEALNTGDLYTVQERSITFIPKYLQLLLEQIGSQFTSTATLIGCQYAPILDDLDIQSDAIPVTDQESDRYESESRSRSDHSHNSCGVDPSGAELEVYSSANGMWLGVFCELDSSTRGDWISEELVNKLGVQAEISTGKSVYLGSQGQEVRPHRTVLLRWHFSTSTQTRENWFHVMGGSFDIVIGSEFLGTHGVWAFHKTAPWATGDNSEATKEPTHNCSHTSSQEKSVTTCKGVATADEEVPRGLSISLAGLESRDKKHTSFNYASHITLEQSNSYIQSLPRRAPQSDKATTGDQDRAKNAGNTLNMAQYHPANIDSGLASWPSTPTTNDDGLNVFQNPSAEAGQYTFNGKSNAPLAKQTSPTKANAFEPDLLSGLHDGEHNIRMRTDSNRLGHEHEPVLQFGIEELARRGDLPCNIRNVDQRLGIDNSASRQRVGFNDLPEPSEAILLGAIPDLNEPLLQRTGEENSAGRKTHYTIEQTGTRTNAAPSYTRQSVARPNTPANARGEESSARLKNRVPRACEACRRRKIRCEIKV